VSAGGPPCTDGSHTYAAVGAALAAANPGDELVVCPGVYDEEVVVDKALRLDSFAGPAQTTLHGLVVTADGARVSGFRLRSLEVDGAAGVELWGNVVIEDEIYLPLVLKN
jgi:nitrous oxidase accessory protein NosD